MVIWDFMVVVDDGTEVYLHPNWSNPKTQCYRERPTPDHELPASGMGVTSGPVTFKYLKLKHVEEELRFRS